jgi:hypothetical protein
MPQHPNGAPSIADPTRTELDSLVINTELTLISIIQGIALYFLAEASYPRLLWLDLEHWPYIATGLCIILIFWSRSILHAFTVIRWPLRLGHNFLYIACTLVEAVMFTQVGNPLAWHVAGAFYSLSIWLLFAIDMRLIHDWARDRTGNASETLVRALERDQLLNVRVLMPATAAFYGLASAAMLMRPPWFGTGVVMALGLVQLAWTIGYLAYVVAFHARLGPLILTARKERREITAP